MAVWRFTIRGKVVRYGGSQREKVSRKGCNEPFKGRYWCPKIQWFKLETCPFANRNECENFKLMCGSV